MRRSRGMFKHASLLAWSLYINCYWLSNRDIQENIHLGRSWLLNSFTTLIWNVNGLSPYKMQDSVLGDFFKRFDLILLSETWTSNQDNYEMDGYIFKNVPRKRIHPNAKRHSGGLCVLYKRSMTYVFELMPTSDDSSVIIRMKSCETFDCRDVYIIHSYIPHIYLFNSFM